MRDFGVGPDSSRDASLTIDVEGMRRRIGEKDTSAGGSVNDFQLVAIRSKRSAAANVASQGNVCGSRATPGSPTRFDHNLQQPGDGSQESLQLHRHLAGFGTKLHSRFF